MVDCVISDHLNLSGMMQRCLQARASRPPPPQQQLLASHTWLCALRPAQPWRLGPCRPTTLEAVLACACASPLPAPHRRRPPRVTRSWPAAWPRLWPSTRCYTAGCGSSSPRGCGWGVEQPGQRSRVHVPGTQCRRDAARLQLPADLPPAHPPCLPPVCHPRHAQAEEAVLCPFTPCLMTDHAQYSNPLPCLTQLRKWRRRCCAPPRPAPHHEVTTHTSFADSQAEEAVLYPFMERKMGQEGHKFSEASSRRPLRGRCAEELPAPAAPGGAAWLPSRLPRSAALPQRRTAGLRSPPRCLPAALQRGARGAGGAPAGGGGGGAPGRLGSAAARDGGRQQGECREVWFFTSGKGLAAWCWQWTCRRDGDSQGRVCMECTAATWQSAHAVQVTIGACGISDELPTSPLPPGLACRPSSTISTTRKTNTCPN